MARALYALLVGIDAYQWPIPPLFGARADVIAATAHLSSGAAAATGWAPLTLLDEQATRAAVIDAIGTHLGRAGRGDTALFWFSGHGSLTPLPPDLAHLEPSGFAQSLVCADSRHNGVPDLLDHELGALIGEVAATGAHAVVVLDCCHAESGTRDEDQTDVRCAPPATDPPDSAALLPSWRLGLTRDGVPTHRPDHVLLAACRTDQRAREDAMAGGHRGAFSNALLTELERRPKASYRELVLGARRRLDDRPRIRQQEPVLAPATSALIDQPFLGGVPQSPASRLVMRHVRGAWEVDGGALHGLATDPDDPARVAVRGLEPLREAEVTMVWPGRSQVVPLGWEPDQDRDHPIVVSRLPLPPATVAVAGEADTVTRILTAVRCASPGGGPSQHVRPHLTTDRQPPDLVVLAPEPGTARIHGPRDCPTTARLSVLTDDDAATVVAHLEHIARWRSMRALRNPLSRLTGAMRLEIVPALHGEYRAPAGRPALPADDGMVRLWYSPRDGNWAPPSVFVRLRNTTDRPLYCVLLDLTDRYHLHPDLFPGAMVAAGHTVVADHGEPIEVTLPGERTVAPGATVTDWLTLLVAEQPFDGASFHLPQLGQVAEAEPSRTAAVSSVLDRLGHTALHRTSPDPQRAADWAVETLTLVTRVPASTPSD